MCWALVEALGSSQEATMDASSYEMDDLQAQQH